MALKEYAVGHRERLRHKYLETGLVESELLELMLTYAVPRVDVKPIAKALLKEFGSIYDVITAPLKDLMKIPGIGQNAGILLNLFHVVDMRSCVHLLKNRPIFHNFDVLENYALKKLSHLKIEEFHVLYLDREKRLLKEDLHAAGTNDYTTVYPREIVRRAMDLNAKAVFLMHNHPGGHPMFSAEDIDLTYRIIKVLKDFEIEFMDHILISGGRIFAARNEFLK